MREVLEQAHSNDHLSPSTNEKSLSWGFDWVDLKEEEKVEEQADSNILEAVMAGAFAVNQEGEVPRAGLHDTATAISELETVHSDPATTPRDDRTLLVEARLARPDNEELVARLQEENMLLRQSVPLAQAEVAQVATEESVEEHEDYNAETEIEHQRKRRRKRFVVLGVAILVVGGIIGVVMGISTGGGSRGGDSPTSSKEANGLVMILFGVASEFTPEDSDLWTTTTEEYIEDYYDRGRLRLLLYHRYLQASTLHNLKTTLKVLDTNVIRGDVIDNGTNSSLQVIYNQSITYTPEGNNDFSVESLVAEPFRSSSSRLAYATDLKDAGMAEGNGIFDTLVGVSEVVAMATIPTPSPTRSVPSTDSPTLFDPASPPPTSEQMVLNPTVFPAKIPTRRPAMDPTPRPTSPPSRAPSGLLPNGPWQPVGQVLHGKAERDYFGESIALSRDGTVMGVGAAPSGSSKPDYVLMYRYNQVTQRWTRMGQDLVGTSVSLNGDGTILSLGVDADILSLGENANIVERTAAGKARVFEYSSTTDRWVQLGSDIIGEASYAYFGRAVSLSEAGDILAVGAWNDEKDGYSTGSDGNRKGSVQVFQYNRSTSSWEQLGQKLFGRAANDQFGVAVSLNRLGTILGVGADRHDSGGLDAGQVSMYEYNSASRRWDPLGDSVPGQFDHGRFGRSLALDDTGLIMAAGTPEGNYRRAQVYAYNRASTTWQQRGQTLVSQQPGDFYGWSLSLSGNGNVFVVAMSRQHVHDLTEAGQVGIFQYDSNINEWKQVGERLTGDAKGDWFGSSVTILADGNVVGVGAIHTDVISDDSGSAYVFTLNKK